MGTRMRRKIGLNRYTSCLSTLFSSCHSIRTNGGSDNHRAPRSWCIAEGFGGAKEKQKREASTCVVINIQGTFSLATLWSNEGQYSRWRYSISLSVRVEGEWRGSVGILPWPSKVQLGVSLTFRRLMSYIYGAPILDVSRPHTTTQHSR